MFTLSTNMKQRNRFRASGLLHGLMALGFVVCAPGLLSASIVGSYIIPDPEEPTHDNVVIVFLPNGEYFFAQDGDPAVDPDGQDGMESGTYTWDPDTGDFFVTTVVNTSGNWGLSDDISGREGMKAFVDDTSITFRFPDEGKEEGEEFTLARVIESPENPLVGGWWVTGFGDELAGRAGGTVVMVFLADGTFYMIQDGDTDPSGEDGMERGTYTWDETTGAISVNLFVDTNEEWGFSHNGLNPTIILGEDGNHFILDPDKPDEGVNVLSRIIPGSKVLSGWAEQLGLTGADAAPEARPFSDGLPNLVRYALGLDATPSPEEYPVFGKSNEPASADFAFEYSQRHPLVGVALNVEWSVDLVTWEDVPMELVVPLEETDDSSQRFSVEIPVSENERRYLRLSARLLD